MKQARPRLELLEARNLLATLLWNPAASVDLHWSVAGNWIDLSTGSRAFNAPKAGDSLWFSNANSASSIDNIPLTSGQSFANIQVKTGFGGTITLDDSLSVQSFTYAGNATITGDSDFTLLGKGAWSSGTMSGSGRTLIAPGASLTLSGTDAETDPTLSGRSMIVQGGSKAVSSSLPESSFQVTMTSGILFLQGNASVVVDGSFLVKGNQNILIGGFDSSTLAEFKVGPGGLLRVNLPGSDSLHINAYFENSSASASTQIIVAGGDISLYQGGKLSGKVFLGGAGKASMTFDQSGQDAQYEWQQGLQFTGQGTVLVKGEGAGADLGSARHDATINVEADQVTFGSSVKFDAWGGALVGPGALRFTAGTTYLDGFLVWASDDSGTNAAQIIIDTNAKVVFRGAEDAAGNFLSPAILRGATVKVSGTLEFAGQVFMGWDAYGMPIVNELTDADPLDMYMGNNAQVSFSKGSSLVLADAVLVKPYNTKPNTPPKLLLQNGALLIKIATDIQTTSAIGPGIMLPGFDPHRQIVYQATAGMLDVCWQMTVDGPPDRVTVTDPPAGKNDISFKFAGPLDTSTPAVKAGNGSAWTGTGTVTADDINNSGAITPGLAGKDGTFEFNGDLNLASTSSIGLDVYGPSASGNYDQVVATGFTQLGGSLSVGFSGYVPVPGDTYLVIVLPGGYTGTFPTVRLPSFKDEKLQVNYDPNDVSITVVADPSKPTITQLSSNSGSTAGGQPVIITGTGFRGVQSVTFGGVPALDWTINSSNQITAIAPPHAPTSSSAPTYIKITTAAGSAQAHYTYVNGPVPTISDLETSSGYVTGGDTILIDGSNFTGSTAVTFGGLPAVSFRVLSDTQISAMVPAIGSPGAVDVHVSTFSGTSPITPADVYTYLQQPAPSVTGLSIDTGSSAGGTSVTITGTDLVNVYDVQFGGVSANSFKVNSPTSITAIAPPDAPGMVDVTVVTLGGVSATSGADQFTYYPASNPAITGVSPNQGYTTGGTTVTISGVHFTGVTSVLFGTVAASHFTVKSDTTIIAVVPAGAGGTMDVTVATATATSADTPADRFTYLVPPLPVVTSLSTSSGSTSGGTVVTVFGSGFTTATAVTFGGVQASKLTILSDSALIATAPADSAGPVDVQVIDPAGTSLASVADQFTYVAPVPVVLAVTPSSGSTTGGNTITVLGTGFTGATAVAFNGVHASSFTVQSDNAISVVTPGDSAGTVDVTVTTVGGTSLASAQDQFTFVTPPPPKVTGLSTISGGTSGGTVVVITGSNFTGATQVDFGTLAATSFMLNSDTQITAVAPAEAPGTVDVTVTTAEGVSSASQNDQFTYQAVIPTVAGVSPSAGPLSGGNSVTITGTGFLGATSVTFGPTAAQSFSIVNDSTLVAVAPAESAGLMDVTVATSAGTSGLSSADKYSFAPAPTINFVTPFSDTATGGVPITITGSGFTGLTAVSFGNTPATSFTVNSDTSLTVTAPAHTVGNTTLILAGPGGQSNTEPFSFTPANTVTWNGGNGDWATASNWSGGQLPGSGDDVVIPAGVTLTHSTGGDTIHRISGSGTLIISGGTLTVGATGSLASLTLSGGSLNPSGALTVTGNFTWGGGSLTASSPFSLQGTSSLAGSLSLAGTVNNSGNATWTGDGTLQFLGATWTNAAGSTFTASSNDTQQTVGGTGTFINAGTFHKTGSAPTSFQNGVAFTSSGTLTIDAGTVTLAGGSNSGTISVASGAQLIFGGNFTLTSSSSITGAGVVNVASGQLGLGGTVSAASVTIAQGARAGGAATINAAVTNNGTLSDGGMIGVLTINGNFTQSSSGTLSVSIGGATAGTTYDQLRISGMAALGGTLNVAVVNSYAPPPGTSFTMLTYDAFSGNFGSIQSFGATFTPQYNSTTFNLVAMADSLQPGADDTQLARPSDSETEARPVATSSDDDRTSVVQVAMLRDERPASDLVFTSARDDSASSSDDGVWDDGASIQEMLSLPLRMVEDVIDALV
jgi:hypothetical protein